MARLETDGSPSIKPGLPLADPKSRIYLHCLDLYHYGRAIRDNRIPFRKVVREGRLAFRLAILLSDRIFLPASSYFEAELAQQILAEHPEFADLGMVYLSAGEDSLEAHRDGKVPQYPRGIPGGGSNVYTALPVTAPPSYEQKPGSSREKIERRWKQIAHSDRLDKLLADAGARFRNGNPEEAWTRVPELLEESAFVAPHAQELLGKQGVVLPEMAVSRVIEPAYIDGYADSLGALIVGDLVYLASPFELAAETAFSYRQAAQDLSALGLLGVIEHANANELLSLKASAAWQHLSPSLRNREPLEEEKAALAAEARKAAEGHHSFPRMGRTDCQIGIVTALPEEFVAMKHMLTGDISVERPRGDRNSYVVGDIGAYRDGKRVGTHRVALTLLKKAGTESAGVAATNLLRSFPATRLVLMVGIACGVPNPKDGAKHVRLGDIIVADRQGVVDPTSGAATDEGFEHRELLPPPSASVLAAVNALEADLIESGLRPWEDRIESLAAATPDFKRPAPQKDALFDKNFKKIRHPKDKRREGRARKPIVFRGPIASSNILYRSAEERDELVARYKLRGIEMEGSGIATATWDRDQSYGVVRASSDYGDGSKTDDWHHYAAAAAAAYAACLIERIAPEDLLEE
jgi:nucleoside phosphorylase